MSGIKGAGVWPSVEPYRMARLSTTGGTMHIHTAMLNAMKEIARIGIGKTQTASLGGGTVAYRGIEAAMNEMSGVLCRNAITVTPRYSDAQFVERVKEGPKGTSYTRFALVRGTFTFASTEDGSTVVSECYGEAMDNGDKAMTKAQSVAFRTALFQTFIVPTMAIDPEADPESAEPPDGLSENVVADMRAALNDSATLDELREQWAKASQLAQSAQDAAALKEFKAAKDKRKAALDKDAK
jgi:hypothetical protein